MKKYNLFKIIMLCFLRYILLTWLIPTGTYTDGTFTLGTRAPLGLFDIIRQPLSTVANFIHYGMIILTIGGLYGVMNKTGVYSKVVDSIARIFKNKKILFLFIIGIFMSAFSAILGETLLLFSLLPFLVAVLMTLGYSKKNALLASIAPIFFGTIASFYSLEVSGYQKYFLGIEYTAINWIVKLIFALILVALLVLYVCMNDKKKTVKEKVIAVKTKTKAVIKDKVKEIKTEKIEEIPFLVKVTGKKKSALPLVIISALTFILLAIGLYNWSFIFEISSFENLHTSISNVAIKDFSIITSFLGSVTALGTWDLYFLAILFIMESLLIGWLYSLKFRDILDAFMDGVKKMAKPAFYYVFASVIIISVLTAASSIVVPIINWIMSWSSGFSVIPTVVAGLVSSLFFNDFTQGLYVSYPMLSTVGAEYVPLTGFIYQIMQGISYFILPTSAILVAGLTYLDIPFKEWFKYIWKFVLGLFVLGLVFILIAGVLL